MTKHDTLRKKLQELLKEKESNDLEFKSAKGGFPHSFWETYSSFANTHGGAIVFGIKEKDNQFFLDGLTEEQVEKYKRDFFNAMHNKEKVNIPLLKDDDVQVEEIEGVCFLFFYVPRVDRSLRPVYCGLDPYTGTYRRDIEGDYHCTREEVNSMFADANLTNPVDGRILKNYGKKDLDANSIKQYRRRFEQWNPEHVWNALSEDEFLEKINVFRRERETGEYGLTYAGLLMFGTYSAIMDANPNFFPDYQEIQDVKERWVNRICPDGNWESNLFQFYSKVLPILQNFLPKPFVLEDSQRKTETPAHIAIREAFANALVHADYTENASLNIYKYPNKIVFSNPGIMLVSLKQYYKGGESVCRNKYLQTMFTFLGSAEKAGSGADKIVHGWEKNNWKRPFIEEKTKPNKVVLTMSMEFEENDNIALKEDNIALKEDNIALKEDNIALKEDNIVLGEDNIVLGSDNIALQEDNIALKKKRISKEELREIILGYCTQWRSVEEISNFVGKKKSYIGNIVLPQLLDALEKKYDVPHHPKQQYRVKE